MGTPSRVAITDVGSGMCQRHLLLTRRLASPLFHLLDVLFGRNLDGIELFDRVRFEPTEHLGEHVEAFALILL